jgi:hypothetical protein
MTSLSSHLLALSLAVSVASCAWQVRPGGRAASPEERSASGQRIGESVVLRINAGKMGERKGELESVLRNRLLGSGAFARVYLSTDLPSPISLWLVIEDVAEDFGASGSILDINLFDFVLWPFVLAALPGKVIGTCPGAYGIGATTTLLQNGRELARFGVDAYVMASGGLGHRAQCEKAARSAAFTALAERVVAKLNRSVLNVTGEPSPSQEDLPTACGAFR